MDKFVFEADIIVPRLEVHRHRFVLDTEAMKQLLAATPMCMFDSSLTVTEVRDLIKKEGEISDVLKLRGDEEVREAVLTALATHAWLNDVPWTITMIQDDGMNEPRFGKLAGVYMEQLDA